jgi:RNA polymerase sigma factor (sigma-70 family)
MAAVQLGAVLRYIRSLDLKSSQQTDGALLRAFVESNDQAAFEALLRRHGPMVLRVCARSMGNLQDAEDALQATFLLLAQRAGSIRKQESLASWLHGVAYRMATHAKRAAARRRKHESQVRRPEPQDPALRAAWQEIQVVLDEEIERLPESFRGPFVLCCLENKSNAEAARQLGLTETTVGVRLSRARKLLQQRLTRRGVSLTAVLAVIAISPQSLSATLSRSLVGSTTKAAVQTAAGQSIASGLVSAKVATLVLDHHHMEKFSGQDLCVYRGAVPDPDHKDIFQPAGIGDQDRWFVRKADTNAEQIPDIDNAVKVIDVKEDGETRVELFVDRGLTARIAVQDADGKPLTGAWAGGLTDCDPFVYKLPEATATVYALNPDKPRAMAFFHAEKELGGTATVRGDEKGPVVVKLAPLGQVFGRLLDADGKPLEAVEVSLMAQTRSGGELYRVAAPPSAKPVRPDKDGRFHIEGVVPGLKFLLLLRGQIPYYPPGGVAVKQVQVKPGEKLDLGDVRIGKPGT